MPDWVFDFALNYGLRLLTDWIGAETLPFLALGPLALVLGLLRSFWKLPASVLFTIFIIGLGVSFWYSHVNLREEIAALREDRENLISAIEIQQRTIDEQGAAIVLWRTKSEELHKALGELGRISDRYRAETEKLKDDLKREDLSARARTNPDEAARDVSRNISNGMRGLYCSSRPSGDC